MANGKRQKVKRQREGGYDSNQYRIGDGGEGFGLADGGCRAVDHAHSLTAAAQMQELEFRICLSVCVGVGGGSVQYIQYNLMIITV